MKLLLISNSTNVGESYLGYSKKIVKEFISNIPKDYIFIPFAAVTFSYDEYEERVNESWKEIGVKVTSIHHYPKEEFKNIIKNAKLIVVGGGNTWKLVKILQDYEIMNEIRETVKKGIPYIGWSAGINIVCPTLKTTNDMPIVEPSSFKTLNLIPFQINPHYTDKNIENFGGETREQRIKEFLVENQNIYVVGLREGSILLYDENLKLIGNKAIKVFKYNSKSIEIKDKLDFLFN